MGPIILDLEGTEVRHDEEALLRHPNTAGVILFSKNFQSRAQLIELTTQIRSIARHPLLICVDHEGGRVWRFHAQFTHIPPQQYFGSLWDVSPERALTQAKRAAEILADELLACGIDFSLTPNLDLRQDLNPVVKSRAFHHDPAVVIALARAFVSGMQNVGMLATGKHFPGHGGCTQDTHIASAVDQRSLVKLQNSDLKPYKALAKMLQIIVVSHVLFPKVDNKPACFSKRWIDLLREQYAFEGIVMSDCLSMKAAAHQQSLTQRVKEVLNAGCDLAIVSQFSRQALYELLDKELPQPSKKRLACLQSFRETINSANRKA